MADGRQEQESERMPQSQFALRVLRDFALQRMSFALGECMEDDR